MLDKVKIILYNINTIQQEAINMKNNKLNNVFCENKFVIYGNKNNWMKMNIDGKLKFIYKCSVSNKIHNYEMN